MSSKTDDVLFYVKRCQEDGFTPSLKEIAKAVGVSSTSTAAYHLRRLELEGRVAPREPYGRRIRVLL